MHISDHTSHSIHTYHWCISWYHLLCHKVVFAYTIAIWVRDAFLVALGEEGVHCLLAVDGLDVLVSLEEKLVYLEEGLDDVHVLGKSFLELRREVLLDVDGLVGFDWLWHDLSLEEHVAPQVLELHVVVVLDVAPRRLVHLDVVALAPLVLVVVYVGSGTKLDES